MCSVPQSWDLIYTRRRRNPRCNAFWRRRRGRRRRGGGRRSRSSLCAASGIQTWRGLHYYWRSPSWHSSYLLRWFSFLSFFQLKRKENSSAVFGVLIDDYREGFVVVVVVIPEKDKVVAVSFWQVLLWSFLSFIWSYCFLFFSTTYACFRIFVLIAFVSSVFWAVCYFDCMCRIPVGGRMICLWENSKLYVPCVNWAEKSWCCAIGETRQLGGDHT